MSHELLFEIGTEEIPASFIQPALDNLQRLLTQKLTAQGLPFAEVRGVATPRRLAVSVTGLAARQPDRKEEVMGPPKKAAFDTAGAITKAGIGFAQSRGARVEDLQVVSTPKGDYVTLVQENKGAATSALLPAILKELVLELPFKKTMRWGAGKLHFVRPIQWLLALYGGQVVELTIDGRIKSGATTRGHRFHAPQAVEVTGFSDYLERLKQADVLAEVEDRRAMVRQEITRAAGPTGGAILEDDELLDTVTNLVESPNAVCGTFAAKFLELPREVLITSMREHQKYFAVVDETGGLMPHFVAVNNTRVRDPKITTAGHQRVLRARLEDAFFFFRADQAKPLAARVDDLAGVVFQAQLGTLKEKTSRLVALTGFLAEQLAPEASADATRAALLAKADLLTSMVGEFPALQGVMGREYARRQGESAAVALAIHEHYLPVRAGGELPQGTAGALVGLADRLDTIAGCFGINKVPTGSADPFGLRRQAVALLTILQDRAWPLSLRACVSRALAGYGTKITGEHETVVGQVIDFIRGRFTNDLTAQGVPAEAVEAVTSVTFDDVVDCRRKIAALMAISDQPAFTMLAGAFKRVRNIIKDHDNASVDVNLLVEAAEKNLNAALIRTTSACEPFLAQRDYGHALAVILTMKEPVDTFFDDVMVMVEDKALRANRLALLTAVSELFLKVGDFSRMYAMTTKCSES